MAFVNLLKPTSQRPRFTAGYPTLGGFIKDLFSPQALMTIGALVQTGLMAILPWRVAVLPAVLLGTGSLVRTVIQASDPAGSIYKTSAQLPDPVTHENSSVPADHSVTVLLLGMQINHPLGFFAAGLRKLGADLQAMEEDIEANADDYGLLGVSSWRAEHAGAPPGDMPSGSKSASASASASAFGGLEALLGGSRRRTGHQLLMLFYFRSVEGVHRFAHAPAHRAGWNNYNRLKLRHIGFMHEMFSVPRHMYESVYLNCSPNLLSATHVHVDSDSSPSA